MRFILLRVGDQPPDAKPLCIYQGGGVRPPFRPWFQNDNWWTKRKYKKVYDFEDQWDNNLLIPDSLARSEYQWIDKEYDIKATKHYKDFEEFMGDHLEWFL